MFHPPLHKQIGLVFRDAAPDAVQAAVGLKAEEREVLRHAILAHADATAEAAMQDFPPFFKRDTTLAQFMDTCNVEDRLRWLHASQDSKVKAEAEAEAKAKAKGCVDVAEIAVDTRMQSFVFQSGERAIRAALHHAESKQASSLLVAIGKSVMLQMHNGQGMGPAQLQAELLQKPECSWIHLACSAVSPRAYCTAIYGVGVLALWEGSSGAENQPTLLCDMCHQVLPRDGQGRAMFCPACPKAPPSLKAIYTHLFNAQQAAAATTPVAASSDAAADLEGDLVGGGGEDYWMPSQLWHMSCGGKEEVEAVMSWSDLFSSLHTKEDTIDVDTTICMVWYHPSRAVVLAQSVSPLQDMAHQRVPILHKDTGHATQLTIVDATQEKQCKLVPMRGLTIAPQGASAWEGACLTVKQSLFTFNGVDTHVQLVLRPCGQTAGDSTTDTGDERTFLPVFLDGVPTADFLFHAQTFEGHKRLALQVTRLDGQRFHATCTSWLDQLDMVTRDWVQDAINQIVSLRQDKLLDALRRSPQAPPRTLTMGGMIMTFIAAETVACGTHQLIAERCMRRHMLRTSLSAGVEGHATGGSLLQGVWTALCGEGDVPLPTTSFPKASRPLCPEKADDSHDLLRVLEDCNALGIVPQQPAFLLSTMCKATDLNSAFLVQRDWPRYCFAIRRDAMRTALFRILALLQARKELEAHAGVHTGACEATLHEIVQQVRREMDEKARLPVRCAVQHCLPPSASEICMQHDTSEGEAAPLPALGHMARSGEGEGPTLLEVEAALNVDAKATFANTSRGHAPVLSFQSASEASAVYHTMRSDKTVCSASNTVVREALQHELGLRGSDQRAARALQWMTRISASVGAAAAGAPRHVFRLILSFVGTHPSDLEMQRETAARVKSLLPKEHLGTVNGLPSPMPTQWNTYFKDHVCVLLERVLSIVRLTSKNMGGNYQRRAVHAGVAAVCTYCRETAPCAPHPVLLQQRFWLAVVEFGVNDFGQALLERLCLQNADRSPMDSARAFVHTVNTMSDRYKSHASIFKSLMGHTRVTRVLELLLHASMVTDALSLSACSRAMHFMTRRLQRHWCIQVDTAQAEDACAYQQYLLHRVIECQHATAARKMVGTAAADASAAVCTDDMHTAMDDAAFLAWMDKTLGQSLEQPAMDARMAQNLDLAELTAQIVQAQSEQPELQGHPHIAPMIRALTNMMLQKPYTKDNAPQTVSEEASADDASAGAGAGVGAGAGAGAGTGASADESHDGPSFPSFLATSASAGAKAKYGQLQGNLISPQISAFVYTMEAEAGAGLAAFRVLGFWGSTRALSAFGELVSDTDVTDRAAAHGNRHLQHIHAHVESVASQPSHKDSTSVRGMERMAIVRAASIVNPSALLPELRRWLSNRKNSPVSPPKVSMESFFAETWMRYERPVRLLGVRSPSLWCAQGIDIGIGVNGGRAAEPFVAPPFQHSALRIVPRESIRYAARQAHVQRANTTRRAMLHAWMHRGATATDTSTETGDVSEACVAAAGSGHNIFATVAQALFPSTAAIHHSMSLHALSGGHAASQKRVCAFQVGAFAGEQPHMRTTLMHRIDASDTVGLVDMLSTRGGNPLARGHIRTEGAIWQWLAMLPSVLQCKLLEMHGLFTGTPCARRIDDMRMCPLLTNHGHGEPVFDWSAPHAPPRVGIPTLSPLYRRMAVDGDDDIRSCATPDQPHHASAMERLCSSLEDACQQAVQHVAANVHPDSVAGDASLKLQQVRRQLRWSVLIDGTAHSDCSGVLDAPLHIQRVQCMVDSTHKLHSYLMEGGADQLQLLRSAMYPTILFPLPRARVKPKTAMGAGAGAGAGVGAGVGAGAGGPPRLQIRRKRVRQVEVEDPFGPPLAKRADVGGDECEPAWPTGADVSDATTFDLAWQQQHRHRQLVLDLLCDPRRLPESVVENSASQCAQILTFFQQEDVFLSLNTWVPPHDMHKADGATWGELHVEARQEYVAARTGGGEDACKWFTEHIITDCDRLGSHMTWHDAISNTRMCLQHEAGAMSFGHFQAAPACV